MGAVGGDVDETRVRRDLGCVFFVCVKDEEASGGWGLPGQDGVDVEDLLAVLRDTAEGVRTVGDFDGFCVFPPHIHRSADPEYDRRAVFGGTNVGGVFTRVEGRVAWFKGDDIGGRAARGAVVDGFGTCRRGVVFFFILQVRFGAEDQVVRASSDEATVGIEIGPEAPLTDRLEARRGSKVAARVEGSFENFRGSELPERVCLVGSDALLRGGAAPSLDVGGGKELACPTAGRMEAVSTPGPVPVAQPVAVESRQ